MLNTVPVQTVGKCLVWFFLLAILSLIDYIEKKAAALVRGSVRLYVVLSPLELSLPLSVIHSMEGGEHRLQIIAESNLT